MLFIINILRGATLCTISKKMGAIVGFTAFEGFVSFDKNAKVR